MPRVTYTGPHDGVDLVGVGTVTRGESVEVSDDLATELTSRPDWQAAKPPSKPTAKTKEA